MNRNEWAVRQAVRRAKLIAFRFRFGDQLAKVAAARAVLEKHKRLIQAHDKLEERANCSAPEGHVRCQAIHHGRLICDEIALRDQLPKGWVVSVVGELCYCSLHTRHADVVNAPTREAAEAHHRPRVVEEVVRRR